MYFSACSVKPSTCRGDFASTRACANSQAFGWCAAAATAAAKTATPEKLWQNSEGPFYAVGTAGGTVWLP